jgi:hypothetical protein
MHEIPELDDRGLCDFGLVTGGIIAVLFGLAFPWVFGFSYPLWPWILGGTLSVWGLAAPASLNPVYHYWMKFGLLIGKITTPIVLGIVFFCVIMPTGLVMRLFGHDPMTRAIDSVTQSYRVSSTKPAKDHVARPF